MLSRVMAEIINTTPLPKPNTSSAIDDVMNIVFALAGAICLLIITLAGLRYTLSQGNAQQTAQAKNAIIYALVGLIIVILSWGIITFVLERV